MEDIDSLQQDYIPDHLSSDNDSSDDEFKGRYKDFVLEKFLRDPKFEIGMKFESRAQFKSAVTEYGIRMGKPVWTSKNEPTRVRAKCREPCKWFVFASIEKALAQRTWYVERIRSNNNLPTRKLRQTVHKDYQAEISKHVAAKAKTLAIEKIKGSAESQYKKIWQYCEEIKRTHSGCTMEVMFTPFREPGCNPRFMRMYCCLGPLKKGFKDGCKPILCLDGCHIKGRYSGQLLTAIAVDPNNGFWPVGLDRALAEVLPNSEHRYCVQHMYRNFKKKHPGLGLKDRLWHIASTTTVEHFNQALDDLKTYDKEAHAWVKKGPHPRHWCKAFFSKHTQCDMLVNNLCESFNAHILKARDQPIISMMEAIREYLMEKIQKRRAAMKKYKLNGGPLIREIVEERVKRAVQWKITWNSSSGNQAKGPRRAQFAVDLDKNECTCNLWALSGIPCSHAIAALHRAKKDPHKMLANCYHREVFFNIYDNVLQPINGDIQWPQSDMLELDPPASVTQPGRPKKVRKRDVTEGKDHGKRLRKRVVIHCRKCGGIGHNAKTCKNPPKSSTEQQPSQQPAPTGQPCNQRQHEAPTKKQRVSKNQGQRNQQKTQQQPTHQPQSQPSQQHQHINLSPQQSTSRPPVHRHKRSTSKRPLTEADKGFINLNYAYLGKDPPFNVGNWQGRGGERGRGRGRGRGKGPSGTSS
ncbi:uncharacterized protein LOC113757758 [Coffea eugenioides]|uniref:uncharacterized protein LOC113757758 n=1 Tax=Coffea eugenioides TaxID=49369 RepID=UPI000F60CCF1|nr:uncharacterized protein LOC113757758 [Coffea eugenioides]